MNAATRAAMVKLTKTLADFSPQPHDTAWPLLIKRASASVDELLRDVANYRIKQDLRLAQANLAAVLADFSIFPPFIEVKKEAGGLEVSGYASTFNTVDQQGDIVDAGAFSATIEAHRKAGTMPIMLMGHNPDRPIGVWKNMSQDCRGLHVDGMLLTGVKHGKEAATLLQAKAINGLSIGFRCKKSAMIAGVRHIMAADLLEISLVSFPADNNARLVPGMEV